MQTTTASLGLGEHIPDFDLAAPDGRRYSPSTFPEDAPFCVVFLANHCPYVASWDDRLIGIANDYSGRVPFAGISSNDISKFPQDGPEEMARRGYPFPYLYDETQEVARAFGATRTPEVFLFDTDRRLRYHGAIDSDWEEGENAEPYLRQALDALLAGNEVATEETKPLGCTIKLRQ